MQAELMMQRFQTADQMHSVYLHELQIIHERLRLALSAEDQAFQCYK